MQLATKTQYDQLTVNFRVNQAGTSETDHFPVFKLFTPDAQATWLLSEYDPDEQMFFGLCDLGLSFPELGYVALAELQALRGPLRLPVERNLHWTSKGPLSAYQRDARLHGYIQA